MRRWYDPSIIPILEANRIPATFFITGLWANTYPTVVRQLVRNPLFEIGNHSFSHASFRAVCYHLPPAADKRAEIANAQAVLTQLAGRPPKLFRFPGGCYSPDDVRLVWTFGLQVIGWDVASGDAFATHAQAIVNQVLRNAQNGSIIVMHLSDGPNAPKTASALPAIIRGLRARGFTFVRVSTLIAERPR